MTLSTNLKNTKMAKMNNITLTDFANLVATMRKEQKIFFDGVRTGSQRTKCRNLELKVDEALKIIERRNGAQGDLF